MLHTPLTQFCFLPALSHRRKYQKLVDGDRLAGLPTCFSTCLKLSWCCLPSVCLRLLLSFNMFILLLMANFHLVWAQGRGEGIPEVVPFLPQKEATPFKGCFAALPSKVLNAPLFFCCSPACKVLPSLFCPHTPGVTCKKLTAPTEGENEKIKAVIWWALASSKKDNLYIACPLPLTPAHSVLPAQVCCSWTERGKLCHLTTPFSRFGFGGCFCVFCFVCFIRKSAAVVITQLGKQLGGRAAERWVRVMPELQMSKKFSELWL